MKNTTTQWRRRHSSFRKIYLSFYLKGLRVRGSWRLNKDCNILTPSHSHGHQRCVFLVRQSCSTGGPGAQLSAECWLSLPHLVSNSSALQLADFLSPPSYIIVQSPTQSLEWHVWSLSSGNYSHAVQRSLSSGASVYECTMGFYLVPFCRSSPPTRFLLITAIGMCHFLPVHHFRMACLSVSKVNIPLLWKQAISFWIDKYPDTLSPRFNNKCIIEGIEIIRYDNSCHFNNIN